MGTKVINFIAGPGAGKTVFAASLFAYMKMQGELVEFVPEYAKTLVWSEDWELLSNQHHVVYHQYKQLNQIKDKVDYIVMDGSLLLGAFYAFYNDFNIADPEKTEQATLGFLSEFNNEYVFIKRNPEIPFEGTGRIHTEEESKESDKRLKAMLDSYGFDYLTVNNEPGDIEYVYRSIR